MKKRLYVAYGSNLNKEQMKHRCPTARLYGTGVLTDFELQFKGRPGNAFATIAPKDGGSVPVAIWEIQPRDEAALDRYEGYPNVYFKQNVQVQSEGKEVKAMVYIMDQKMDFGPPSSFYYRIVQQGYEDCGLDTKVLKQALYDSEQKFLSSAVGHAQRPPWFESFDKEAQEDMAEMKYEELEDTDSEEESENPGWLHFGGMQL